MQEWSNGACPDELGAQERIPAHKTEIFESKNRPLVWGTVNVFKRVRKLEKAVADFGDFSRVP